MAPEPVLDAIGVVASDLAASAAFYRRLGLVFPEFGPDEDHVEAPIGGGVRLMLDSEALIRTIDPEWQGSTSGRVSVAVRCSSPAEVDSLYTELAADGFGDTEPWDAVWGQRYAVVHDPDGQHVDLYASLETSEGVGAAATD